MSRSNKWFLFQCYFWNGLLVFDFVKCRSTGPDVRLSPIIV